MDEILSILLRIFPQNREPLLPLNCGVGVRTNHFDDSTRHWRQHVIQQKCHRVRGISGQSEYGAPLPDILNATLSWTSRLSRVVSLTGRVVRCKFRLQPIVLPSPLACMPGRDQAQDVQLSISPRNLLQDLRHGKIALRVSEKIQGAKKQCHVARSLGLPRFALRSSVRPKIPGGKSSRVFTAPRQHSPAIEGGAKWDLGMLTLLII